jgi:hypothetical protein
MFYTEGVHPVTEDVLKSITWRFNSNVTYETFIELCETGLTLEALLDAHK